MEDQTALALITIWRIENPDSLQEDEAEIESALRDRRWWALLVHFRSLASEAAAFEALETIAPLMTREELAGQLANFYTGAKSSATSDDEVTRLLMLFRQANLRDSVPDDLPSQVRIFRGVRAADHIEGRRRIRCGISWTLSQQIATNFALGLPNYKPKADFPGLRSLHSFVGTALIDRDRILAFFDDWRHESECVVDPAEVFAIEVSELAHG